MLSALPAEYVTNYANAALDSDITVEIAKVLRLYADINGMVVRPFYRQASIILEVPPTCSNYVMRTLPASRGGA